MHFWIDKRSQGCGFGRARVAASLSNSGGAGLGFGHYPPSRRNKSMLMSAPIHRLQSQDFARPTYLTHQQQNNNTNCNNNNNNDNNNSSSNSSHNNNYNRNSSRNNNQNNREYQQYHTNLPSYQSSIQQNNSSQYILQNYEISPHHTSIRNNLNIPSNCNGIINNNNAVGSPRTINITNANNSPNNYHNVSSVPVPQIYGGSSQPQQQSAASNDLEQGTIRSINITRQQHHLQSDTQQLQNIGQYNNIIENRETQQLLPTHLKCGIWASLIVASVCLAGSKFYYDHQGNGVEIFIFFTFLAIFFWAACTVSLCQCPKKLITSSTNRSSTSIINNNRHHNNVDIDNNDNQNNNSISIRNHSLQNHHNQIFIDNNNTEQLNQDIELLSAASAAPPPYHIAILLPDTTKEIVEFDETPPPSYDKVLI